MKIGIIGSGKIGGTLARLFAAHGHEVAVSNSRGPDTLAGLVEELGPGARAVTPAEAARFGDVVVVSIPLGRYRDVPTDGVDADGLRSGYLTAWTSVAPEEQLREALRIAVPVGRFAYALQWQRQLDAMPADVRPAYREYMPEHLRQLLTQLTGE